MLYAEALTILEAEILFSPFYDFPLFALTIVAFQGLNLKEHAPNLSLFIREKAKTIQNA